MTDYDDLLKRLDGTGVVPRREAAAAIRDLTAKLEAVKPRPIEEAPKDGSTVLASWDGRWVETYWVKRDKFEGWQRPSGMVVKAYAPDTWKPTHFIPLSALTALER